MTLEPNITYTQTIFISMAWKFLMNMWAHVQRNCKVGTEMTRMKTVIKNRTRTIKVLSKTRGKMQANKQKHIRTIKKDRLIWTIKHCCPPPPHLGKFLWEIGVVKTGFHQPHWGENDYVAAHSWTFGDWNNRNRSFENLWDYWSYFKWYDK